MHPDSKPGGNDFRMILCRQVIGELCASRYVKGWKESKRESDKRNRFCKSTSPIKIHLLVHFHNSTSATLDSICISYKSCSFGNSFSSCENLHLFDIHVEN